MDELECMSTFMSAQILYMNILSRLDTYIGKLEGTGKKRICMEKVLLRDIVRPPETS